MDDVFRALADPSRRRLLDDLNERDGQTLRELCAGLDMARQSVSKHLAILEAAHLVTTVRRGREKLHHLNAAPIRVIAERWIDRYTGHASRADQFVYTTYIRTTPERLWQAVTNPAFSHRYLGHGIESEWEKGATYIWAEGDLRIEHPDQVIIESDPYRRLAFTFHVFVPELQTVAPELIAAAADEDGSRVVFELDPVGEQVRLTVTHDGFDPGSILRDLVSQEWPAKLSRLKTALEQGGQTEAS